MSEKFIKNFKFHVPVSLSKSEDGETEMKIEGIASTYDEDLQGEVVDQDGLDISLLKAGRGLFNHDHQKGPENVIGQIEDAEFIEHEGKKALWVKGYLFDQQERAKAYYNILKSLKKGTTSRVHFSIEGKILQRSMQNPKKIAKARIDKVALTMDPVNPVTYCSLAKSMAELNEINETIANGGTVTYEGEQDGILITKSDLLKMMSAGAPSGAPAGRVGGEALQKESMDKKIKNVTYKKAKKDKKSMLKSFIDSVSEKHPEIDKLQLAKMVVELYKAKTKDETDGN